MHQTLFGVTMRALGLDVRYGAYVDVLPGSTVAMRRLGFGPVARHFHEVHVVADAHHEQVAAHRFTASLAAQDPCMAADILLGAWAIMAVEGNFSGSLMAAWDDGRTALLRPVEALGIAAVA